MGTLLTDVIRKISTWLRIMTHEERTKLPCFLEPCQADCGAVHLSQRAWDAKPDRAVNLKFVRRCAKELFKAYGLMEKPDAWCRNSIPCRTLFARRELQLWK
jgi:hypothetical protein